MKFIARNVLVAIMLVISWAGLCNAADMGIGADGKCYAFCDVAGIKSLRTSNGYTTNLFSAAHTTPALVVEYNGRRCYADLVTNAGTGINITTSNGTYHTHAPDDCYEPTFWFTPATTSNTYGFVISAAGTYTINWGDGTIQTITKSNTSKTTYSHTYAGAASNYEIGLGGTSTAYNTGYEVGAILFNTDDMRIKSMRGCLGCVFSTLPNGAQPGFGYTFSGNTTLTGSIPPNLFGGISGAPRAGMFYYTFNGCTNMTGSIPAGLFSGIKGAPAPSMFTRTFRACNNLTGSIPAGLFSGIKGEPVSEMYLGTFSGCYNLTGEIPAGLFGNISGTPAPQMYRDTFYNCYGLTKIPAGLFGKMSGAPAEYMFFQTFYNCTGLRGEIPEDLFGDISGTAVESMFQETFAYCRGLTGPSPRVGTGNNKQYLYERWPDTTYRYVTDTSNEYGGYWRGESYHSFYHVTGLTDYDCIPDSWGGPGTKQPGTCDN